MFEGVKGFKEKNPGKWQAIMYAVLGCVASAVELAVFSLCNYLLLSGLDSGFSWWIFVYGEESGGLSYFLSLVISFACAQTVNFIIQRKKTFAADNNAAWSAVMFAMMMIGIFVLQMWLPTVLLGCFSAIMGDEAAEFVIKLLCMFLGFLISFPLNKYVIMRKKK